MDTPTLNQVREIVCHLFNQSKILDECRVQVVQAVSKAISKLGTQLFLPFMSYLSDVSDVVESWCRKITVLCPEMAHCDYDTYHNCVANIWEKTREYFGRLCDLNTVLEQQTTTAKLSNPTTNLILGWDHPTICQQLKTVVLLWASCPPASANEDNPFLVEVVSIMKDVESSIEKYVQAMMKAVVQYLGGSK